MQVRRSRHNRNEAIHGESPSMRRSAATLFIRFHPTGTRSFRIPLWCSLSPIAIDSLRRRPRGRVPNPFMTIWSCARANPIERMSAQTAMLLAAFASVLPLRPRRIPLPFPVSELTAYVFGPTLDWLKTLRRRWSGWLDKIRSLACRRQTLSGPSCAAARGPPCRNARSEGPQGLDRAHLVRIPSRGAGDAGSRRISLVLAGAVALVSAATFRRAVIGGVARSRSSPLATADLRIRGYHSIDQQNRN